jgi:hypothetical protein
MALLRRPRAMRLLQISAAAMAAGASSLALGAVAASRNIGSVCGAANADGRVSPNGGAYRRVPKLLMGRAACREITVWALGAARTWRRLFRHVAGLAARIGC